jgi:hypothetical protein
MEHQTPRRQPESSGANVRVQSAPLMTYKQSLLDASGKSDLYLSILDMNLPAIS